MAPKPFNVTLDLLAQDFENRAKAQKWGVPILERSGTRYLCLLQSGHQGVPLYDKGPRVDTLMC